MTRMTKRLTPHPRIGVRSMIAIHLLMTLWMAETASASSVLATPEQQALDAEAVSILNANSLAFSALQTVPGATYLLAYAEYALLPSAQASSRLPIALNELVFSAIQKAVNDDSQYPQVYWLDAPPRNWNSQPIPGGRYSFDNPDCIYRTIPIDGNSSYVIQGQRTGNGPTDVTFSLISNENSQQSVAVLTNSQLVVNADGSYTITVDSSPAVAGQVNHIQSTSQVVQLLIRNNLGDWNTETPDALTVSLVGTPSRAPLGDAAIVLDADSDLTQSAIDYGVGALLLKTYSNSVNTLPQPSTSSTLGTLTTQYSSFGHFMLTNDQAMIVTVNTGGAGYFVLPVTDPWSITVDPINHQSSLNNKQALPNADGTYTFVISVTDPGVYNWLDPVGLNEGTIMARWQDLPAVTPASGGPAISTQVVALADLATYLPAGTSFVTPSQRAQQLQARAAGYALRVASP